MAISEQKKLTMTIEECAEALGICRATAYMLARQGSLPGCIRLGPKRLVVSKVALQKLLEHSGDGNIPS